MTVRGTPIIAAAALLLVLWCPSLQAERLLKIGVYDFKPLAFVDAHGSAQGFFVDIFNEIARQQGWTVTYVPGTFVQCLQRIKSGEIDLLINLAESEHRKTDLDFTQSHLFVLWAEIYRHQKAQINSLLDLQGKTVGVVKGALANNDLTNLINSFGLTCTLRPYDDYSEVRRAVASAEVDAGLFTNLYGMHLAQGEPLERTPIVFAPTRLKCAVKKDTHAQLLAELDEMFAGLRSHPDSIYYQAQGKWLGSLQKHPVVPSWLFAVLAGLGICALLLAVFSLVLRREVGRKTRGLAQEIAERAKVQEALQSNLQKYRILFNAFPLGITLCDTRGRILETNPKAETLLGLAKSEHEARSIDDSQWRIVRPDGSPMPSSEYPAVVAIAENHPVENALMGFVREDGRTIWLNVTAAPVPSENGVLILYNDITERRRLEEELLAYKNIVSSTEDLISLVDPQYRYRIVNDAYQRFHQKSRAQIVGRGVAELTGTPLFEQVVKDLLDRCLAGETVRYQSWFTFPLNGRRFFDLTYSPFKENGVIKGVAVNGRDLTELKQAEEALREKESLYRALVEGLPDVVMRFDRGGRHLFVSANVRDIVEMEPEEFIGRTHRELGFDEAQSQFWEQAITGVFDSGQPFETEFAFDGKRGPTIFNWRLLPEFDLEGHIRSVLSVSRDVTAQRTAERKYETLFREMLDGFALHEIIVDDQGAPVDYRFLAVNPAFERITGLSAASVVHKTAREVLPEIEPIWVQTYGMVALTGEPKSFESYNKALDKYFQVTAFQSEPGRFACIFHDITEREKMTARIQQAQRIEAIGTLAGGIAHDFNNLLFPIIGLSELLRDDLPVGSEQHENVVQIYTAARRAGELVNQILSFSRQSDHKMVPVKIQPILKEALKLARATIPSSIEMAWDIQQDCGPILADPTQIHQIIMNLVTNAFHAVESNEGRITVRLRAARIGEEQSGSAAAVLPAGRYALLSVADTGCGIAPDVMDKIFEPYFTTKERGKGTGLGLSVVYGIVKEHGGDIRVQSQIGHGATFDIYLPLISRTADADGSQTTDSHPTGTETILLIDDEEAVVRLESKMLERLGYRVIARTGSLDALATFREKPDDFDLVITDMTMPRMTGDKLAETLLALRPGIPIIICTGFSDKLSQERADQIGCRALLLKPVIKSEMARVVREVLDAARGRQP